VDPAATDHKRIGILYIGTSARLLLRRRRDPGAAHPHAARDAERALHHARDSYNELFTMHGTTMIFLVVVPILAGFGNYLVPLMIGARDMAFPRLNALSYWLFLFGGIVLYSSFFAAARGRTAAGRATRRSRRRTSPRHGVDLWILGLHLLTASRRSLGAINFIVTIHNMRAPGMTLDAHAAVRLDDRGLRASC
jgi:cytochrome c oxidase subunit 1